jgi:hypothetical protein
MFICKDISLESHSKIMGITIQGLGNVSNVLGLYTPNINIDWTYIPLIVFTNRYYSSMISCIFNVYLFYWIITILSSQLFMLFF